MLRIGCVSFLNALPLIDGLEGAHPFEISYRVPSALLEGLETRELDVALCPVIDFQRSREPLVVVPVGGIGCDGPTLTVRLMSQRPLGELEAVHVDTDSHTSVALLRVLLAECYGVRPELIDYRATGADGQKRPEAVLLIGDKVVTADAPSVEDYPHQLDLGQAWHGWTGLPFVFAVWMAREGEELGDLPSVLRTQRERNAERIDAIVSEHARNRGWPSELAREYLGSMLRYSVGPREMAGIERFYDLAHRHGLIERRRPLVVGLDWPAPRA